MSIIGRKRGNAKKHNEQILEHNRLNLTYQSMLALAGWGRQTGLTCMKTYFSSRCGYPG